MKNYNTLNKPKTLKYKILMVFIYFFTLTIPAMASVETPTPCNNSDGIDESINEACLLYNSNKKLVIRNKADGQIILFKIIEKKIGNSMRYTRIPISLFNLFTQKNKTNDICSEKVSSKDWESKIHFDLDAGFFNNNNGLLNEQYIAINGNFNIFSMMIVLVFSC